MPAYTIEFTILCEDSDEADSVVHDTLIPAMRHGPRRSAGAVFWLHEATRLKVR